jgi:hypothetical protein
LGIAAQLILMNGPIRRLEFSCSALATSSLPVPLSPVISAVDGVSATFSIIEKMFWISRLWPTRPNRPLPCGSLAGSRVWRGAIRLAAAWPIAFSTIARIESCSNGFSM